MAGFVKNFNPRAGNENLNIDDKVYPSTTITLFDESGAEVGWINEINENQTRNVEPIRHLNAVDAGRIVQAVPRPADYTISVTGFGIYKPDADTEGTIISRLIALSSNPHKLMKSLEEQKIPFSIQKVVENANGENSLTFYHGCWITRFSQPSSINNAFVTESADLFVRFIDDV